MQSMFSHGHYLLKGTTPDEYQECFNVNSHRQFSVIKYNRFVVGDILCLQNLNQWKEYVMDRLLSNVMIMEPQHMDHSQIFSE